MWPFGRRPKPKAKVYVPPPESPEAVAARAALARVPGPSPWYLDGHRDALPIHAGGERFSWKKAPDDPKSAGKTFLYSPNGALVAICDFQCYVRPMNAGRFLVWSSEENGKDATFTSQVRLQVHDGFALTTITNVDAAIAGLGPRRRFHAGAPPLADLVLSTALDDGHHSIAIPEPLRGEGELLILAHSTAEGRRENHYDTMHLRLWLLDTGSGALTIVPQDWFNSGSYDFGYQWVTRVARPHAGGPVYGEGIRLGIFRLDSSLRGVDAWLAQDIFAHPER